MSEKGIIEEIEFFEFNEEDVDYIISQSITEYNLTKSFILSKFCNVGQKRMYVEWKGIIVGLLGFRIKSDDHNFLNSFEYDKYAIFNGFAYPEYRRKGLSTLSIIKFSEILKSKYNINVMMVISECREGSDFLKNVTDNFSTKTKILKPKEGSSNSNILNMFIFEIL